MIFINSGKRLHHEMERSTIFHGTIHYKNVGDFQVRIICKRLPGRVVR